jgi:undecaprenyl-diphosphatase
MSQRADHERRSLTRSPESALRRALYTTLRLIARHVEGFFGALATFVTVGFLIFAAALASFGAMAGAVTQGWTQKLDDSALRWFEQNRFPLADRIMIEISSLGTGLVLVVMIAIASVFLWLTSHRWSAYLLLLSVGGGKLLNTLLKILFARPRPSVVESITEVTSASFPSGHAMSSMVAYGTVAYLVARLEPTPLLRRVTWVLATLVILAIGTSRVYLGVHYPSDVVAGYLGGLAWIAFVAATVTALRFFADRRPETRAEEHDLSR